MATALAQLTPQTDTTPAIVNLPAKELSGAQWVARFPGSRSTSDLAEPFQASVNSFIGAIEAAGGTVSIGATYRPPERAYLMHYSSKLSRGEIAAANIPAMAGVNIEWVHATDAESKSAAEEMVSGYGIVFPPALASNHTRRTAIDMTVRNIVGKTINDATGAAVSIAKLSDLNAVGATFGVNKLVSDPPHWSDDGH